MRARRRPHLLLGIALAAVLLALAGAGCTSATTGAATGRTWYLSARAGGGGDGRSWATAWRTPEQVAWQRLAPGDTLLVDGGPRRCPAPFPVGGRLVAGSDCGLRYGPLVVRADGVPGRPVTVALAGTAGRDGTAVFDGGRENPLPYCRQPDWQPVGSAAPGAVVLDGVHDVVVDGTHRGGFAVRGGQAGVDLRSDRTGAVVLRNLDVFDNGFGTRTAAGWTTDGEGVSLVGHQVLIDRSLLHDNGQDEIQDRDTGVPGTGHQPLQDVTVRDSWLFNSRELPGHPGYPFSSGAQDVPAQDCTHVDGIQVWGGGSDQRGFVVEHSILGPLVAQGLYLGDTGHTSVDAVTVRDVLVLGPSGHGLVGESSGSAATPRDWTIDHVTIWFPRQPLPGTRVQGAVDLVGTGHTLESSLLVGGYFTDPRAFTQGADNLFDGGEQPPGGTAAQVVLGGAPTEPVPGWAALSRAWLQPVCPQCSGVGSSVRGPQDLLGTIDRKDGEAAPAS